MSTVASRSSRYKPSRGVKHILPSPTRGGPPRRKPPQIHVIDGPPRRAPPIASGAPMIVSVRREESPKTALIDIDDESDLELLSLSSGDDETKLHCAIMLGNRMLKSQGAAVVETDGLWHDNDEEPQTWGGVDQGELERRVFEIRETRRVPASSSLVTLLRKSTNFMELKPVAQGFIDPIGLGLTDIRNLALFSKNKTRNLEPSTDKWSGSGRGLFEAQDEMSTAKEKVIFHSNNFDARFFLVHIHQNTSAHDLEAAGIALKGDLLSCKEHLQNLVKENFDRFISCKNTIDDTYLKLQQIECAGEGTGTEYLHNVIAKVDVTAKRAFAPLLDLQSQAKRTRSVLRLLKRFRILFNLPATIRSNIRRGDYDLAVRECKKAKLLASHSHVGISGRVLKEVENITQELIGIFYKRMEDTGLEFSQFESTIRLLLELEPSLDLVWHYLTIQDRRIRGLLEGCMLEHEACMNDLVCRVTQPTQSDAQMRLFQREPNKSGVDFKLLLGSKIKEHTRNIIEDSTGHESDKLLIRLIRRLTAILLTHVPKFWDLATSMFNLRLHKVTDGSPDMRRLRSVFNSGSWSYTFGKLAKLNISSHSLNEVTTTVHSIISLYELKVKTAFYAFSEANVLLPYMRLAVSDISKACVVLEGRHCAPAVEMVVLLHTELSSTYVQRLCAFMNNSTADLVIKEDWILVSPTERSGSPFAISNTPLKFQGMLESAMERLNESLDKLKQQSPQDEDRVHQLQHMQDNVQHAFYMCFRTLAEDMGRLEIGLSRIIPEENATEEKKKDLSGPGKLATPIAENEVSDHHQRLLVLLSNARFCNSLLMPWLSKKYQKVWFYEGKDEKREIEFRGNEVTVEDALSSFSSLEVNIINRYKFAKGMSVGIAVTSYLSNDGTYWSASPPVKGIRDAAVELLHPLISVHAEVYAMANMFVDEVIKYLTVELMELLLAVITVDKSEVLKSLDVRGYCQLMLEIEYIEGVLGGYLTPPAQVAALQFRDILLEKVLETVGNTSQRGSRRSTSSDDGDEDMCSFVSMSQGEIQILTENVIATYLPNEFKRTRINVFCFMDKPSDYDLQGWGSVFAQQQARLNGVVPGTVRSRHRRKDCTSSLIDFESEKLVSACLPISPPGYIAYATVRSDDGLLTSI